MKITLGKLPNLHQVTALEKVGEYLTPKAALCRAFGMPDAMATSILRHSKGIGANNILIEFPASPENFMGIGKIGGKWVAVWGWTGASFPTLRDAESFAVRVDAKRRDQGEATRDWLFLERSKIALAVQH